MWRFGIRRPPVVDRLRLRTGCDNCVCNSERLTLKNKVLTYLLTYKRCSCCAWTAHCMVASFIFARARGEKFKNYISGTVQRIQRPGDSGDVRLHLRHLPPLFHPHLWNVHEATLAGDDRTNNLCESWNNAFKHLVGHSHPSIWVVIQALQQGQSVMALTLLQIARGNTPVKRIKRSTVELQQRLCTLRSEWRDGVKSIEILRAIRHSIRDI